MVDFEEGAIAAVGEVFGRGLCRGCYFHFQKCLWRHIQSLNTLAALYRTDDQFALEMRCLAALAFVPPSDVQQVYWILKQRPTFQRPGQMQEFLTYFESTWVGKRTTSGTWAWTPPQFPISLWNVHDATLNDQHRTNNSVEGWHTRFQTLMGSHHPTIFKFLEVLQLEEKASRFDATQLLAGQPSQPSKKKYRLLNDRIVNVVKDYSQRLPLNFVTSIAYNLSFV